VLAHCARPHPPPQGALAPVLASATLFGLYLLLRFFPDLSLQTFLDAYFWRVEWRAVLCCAVLCPVLLSGCDGALLTHT
jgi:hypothetical protein